MWVPKSHEGSVSGDRKTFFASPCSMWWLNPQQCEVPKPDFVQCQYWDNILFLSFLFLIFFFLFSFLLSARLPGNTGSHFTHDLTLGLRIAGTVQLGFSLTGDKLQLGNREVTSAQAHKNQTHERSTEGSVCLPPFKTAEQGQETGTGVQWAKMNFLCSWTCRGSSLRLNRTFSKKDLCPCSLIHQKSIQDGDSAE